MSSTLRKTLLEKKVVSLHISRETLIEYLTESYCLMTRHSITDLLIWKKKPPIDLQNFIDTFFKEKLLHGLSNDVSPNLKLPKPKSPFMEGSLKTKKEELKEEFYENSLNKYQTKNYEYNIESPNAKRLKIQDENVTYSDLPDNLNSNNEQDNIQDSDIYDKINSLRKCGMWPASMLPKIIEYPHPLYLHDYLLHEMKWMSYDFNQERKWKTALAFKIINQTSKYKKFIVANPDSIYKKAINVSSNIADLVRNYWNSIIKMVCQKEEKEMLDKDILPAKNRPIINYGISLMKELMNMDCINDQQILLDLVLPNMTMVVSRDEVEKLISQEAPQHYFQEDPINQVYSSIVLSDEDLLEAVNANLDAPNLISKRVLQNWHCQDDPGYQEDMDFEESFNSCQPKSLFDKPSPILLKLRKEVSNYQRYEVERQGTLYPSQAHFQSQLLNKAKNAFKVNNPLGQPKLAELNLPHKWIITEAWALIKAIKFYQSFYFGTIVLSPGHTPNWDFAAEYTTSVGCTYRSPKECRSYYENIIVPREKNTLSLRDYMSNCKKPKIKHLNKLETGPLLTYKMYAQDKNHSYKKYFGDRLDNILSHKCPLAKHTYQRFRAEHKSPTQPENPQDGTINAVRALGNYGVNYGNPVDPYSLLKCKIDRLVREKKHQQLQQAKNLVPEFSASLHNGTKLSQQLNAPGPIIPEATYPFVPNLQQPTAQQLRCQQSAKTSFPPVTNNNNNNNMGGTVEIALGNGGAFTKICPKNQNTLPQSNEPNTNSKRQTIGPNPANNYPQQHGNSSVNSSFIRANYCQATTQPLLSIQPKPVAPLSSNASGNIFYQHQQQPPLSGLSYVLGGGGNSSKIVGNVGSSGGVYSLLSSMTHEGAPLKRGSGASVTNLNTAPATFLPKIPPTPRHQLVNNVATATGSGDNTGLESSSFSNVVPKQGLPLPISQVYQNLYASNAIYNKVNTLNKWFEKLDKTTLPVPTCTNVLVTPAITSSNVVTNFKIAGLEFLLNNQQSQTNQQAAQQGQGGETGLGINLTSTNIYNLLQQHANSLKARTNPNLVYNPSQQGSGDVKGGNVNLVSILQQQQSKDGNSGPTAGPPIQFYNISQMPVPNQPKLSHKNTATTLLSNTPSQEPSPHTTK